MKKRAADVKNGDLFKSGLSLIPVTVGVTGNSETSSYIVICMYIFPLLATMLH